MPFTSWGYPAPFALTGDIKMDEHPEPLLTPAEVANLFRVDPKTVTRWAKAGKLTAIRTLGGHRRYKEREVRALMAGSQAAADALAQPVSALWAAGVTGAAAKARKLLAAEGVATVGELTRMTAAHLDDLGLRPALVDEVRLALYKRGLALRGEVIDAPLHSVA
jgi:excisionase family DNA binding protein